ncbi:type VI secretion system tip protein VgrG [Pseudomonas sp. F1_0610]|uniref:type VI secretion system Vgr family protein n=1 Tax=Pseudomonas sp. F1_0610 TaxID=3114284 RepID=UPI0039C15C51
MSLNKAQISFGNQDFSNFEVKEVIGKEAISQTYQYKVIFNHCSLNLPPNAFLKKPASLIFSASRQQEKPDKVCPGIVTEFKRLNSSADEAEYSVIIEPKFALLSLQKYSHRFFLNKSVPEVIQQILSEHGFEDWEYNFDLKRKYPQRAQINQYQESDKDFIERLLSELGIFYSFILNEKTQTEIITFGDTQACFEFGKKLALNSPSGMNDNTVASIWGLSYQQSVSEHSLFVKDYNYRQAHELLSSEITDVTKGNSHETNYGRVYNYQARHLTAGKPINAATESANFWAQLDHERLLAEQTLIYGKSTDHTLRTAQTLTITESKGSNTLPDILTNPILITELIFTISRTDALLVNFTATAYNETICWRPQLKPRPIISGTLTARIANIPDQYLYAHQNEQGLYWVRFDADIDEKPEGYSSMPVRLAKSYAGDTYGIHFPLLKGTEVAIAFHEGDPDRPYIAYAFHDSRHPDHVDSRNNTRNVIRTPTNNKLRMEDKRNQEHIKLSTEYGGKTQLNLGHLVNQSREKRGEGFELRTDSWGALRAGKGLYLSTDLQSAALGDVLNMPEIEADLDGAVNQLDYWRDITSQHHSPSPDDSKLKPFAENAKKLKQAAIVLHSPVGIGVFTNETLLQRSNGGFFNQSQGDMHSASQANMHLSAKQKVSILAQQEGMRLVAGKGVMELESHADEIRHTALKDVTIQSTQGHIQVTAKKGITLACGGGYIRITPTGEIEIHSPTKISIRGQHTWDTPMGQSFPLPDLPQSVCKECLLKAQQNTAGLTLRE